MNRSRVEFEIDNFSPIFENKFWFVDNVKYT
jgi:hypothetical protein